MTDAPRSITCRELIEWVWAYLEGDVSGPSLREFELHFEICDACVAYLKSYRQTIHLARQAFQTPNAPAPSEVPEELVQAILAAKRKESPPS